MSKFLNLNVADLIKGAVLAFIVAFLTGALTLFEGGQIQWSWVYWQPTVYAGIVAFIGYLLKNLMTNSDGKMLKKE